MPLKPFLVQTMSSVSSGRKCAVTSWKLGLSTFSGIIESGYKPVIDAGVKQSEMHWSLRGTNAIIALRCSKLSNRFDPFMDHRKNA